MDDSTKSTERASTRNSQPPTYTAPAGHRPLHARAASTPAGPWRSQPTTPRVADERTPLTRSWSTADLGNTGESMDYTGGPVAGGTIMGIHNLAIVFPQFIVKSGSSSQLTADCHRRVDHIQARRRGLGSDPLRRDWGVQSEVGSSLGAAFWRLDGFCESEV